MSVSVADTDQRNRDIRLATRAQAGDRAAFAEIYRCYAQAVFVRVLLPRLGNREAATECLAETFQAAFEHVAKADFSEGGLVGWLMQIAKNKAIDTHRRSATTRRVLGNFETLMHTVQTSDVSAHEMVDARLDAERLRERIARVLAEINPRYRRAIELRCLAETSREDCARELDVQLGTFDVLLLRALRAFRGAWVTRYGEER